MKPLYLFLLGITLSLSVLGQTNVSGKVYDNETKEPLPGATITILSSSLGVVTNTNGQFSISGISDTDTIEVTYMGYYKKRIAVNSADLSIGLTQSVSNLEQIVVTANREATLRTESPIAIAKLSPAIINDTKPVLITELINKVPGLVMSNYNNEQHGMAIRQPMGTSAYFLYMEDGIPIRPMGIFNHNALIEMNVFSISSIEVIKGPASSLYGPEAVGGAINFITHRPTAMHTAKVGVQADQWGYKRFQYAAGGMIGRKVGIYLSGFEGRQRGGWQTSSDYDKSSINARIDYNLSDRTTVTATISNNEYYSQMAGSADSIAFYNREYTSTTDFTYRKVHSLRSRISASHRWNDNNETLFTLVYRDNFIEQNPNYAIRWTTGSTTASGERNRNSFTSNVAMLQHSIKFNFLDAKLLTGGSVDYSPTDYWSYKIDLAAALRDDGMSVRKYTIIQERPDIYLTRYQADLRNYALYSQFELNATGRLKLTAGLRYDKMEFDYNNKQDKSSGNKAYQQVTPKLGATYDLLHDKGVYVNYSEGFSPPGLTSIFRKKSNVAPGESAFYYDLKPAKFNNFEVGGWAAFYKNKIYADVALYQMIGRRELMNVRQLDNSTDYQSAGKTFHRGIEYSVTYRPNDAWSVRFGGTNSIHRFDEFELSTRSSDKVKNVNGKEMPQAPRWIANGEATFRPGFVPGLRISLEWQRIGSWYEDQVNKTKYDDRGFLGLKGISYLNLRGGYEWKGFEIFTSILNLTDELYAHAATRGNFPTDRTTFTPAAPRTFILGMQYTLSAKNRSKS
jgi:iron complex outermembrane recepter protein